MILQPGISNSPGQTLVSSVKSGLIGTGGSSVVALFFMTVMSLESTLAAMPWVIAFTGALTGFRCVEMLKRTRPSGFRLTASVTGVLSGALAWAILNGIGIKISGFLFLSWADLAVYALISGFTGYLGGVLADRYYHL